MNLRYIQLCMYTCVQMLNSHKYLRVDMGYFYSSQLNNITINNKVVIWFFMLLLLFEFQISK